MAGHFPADRWTRVFRPAQNDQTSLTALTLDINSPQHARGKTFRHVKYFKAGNRVATICKSLQIRSCRRLFQSNQQSGKTAAAGICSNATAVSEHRASAL